MGLLVKQFLLEYGETIVKKNPDILIVAYYPRILKKEKFENVPMGAINFHPGYLPYNRGMYPHIWPILDGSPCGVTLHYIDEKVDHGKIIAQKRIPVKVTDTAGDLEDKTQEAIFDLFRKWWPKIKKGVKGRKSQGKMTYHSKKQLQNLYCIDKKVIDRLRASTFRNRSYAYFMHKGKKHYVGVKFFSRKP